MAHVYRALYRLPISINLLRFSCEYTSQIRSKSKKEAKSLFRGHCPRFTRRFIGAPSDRVWSRPEQVHRLKPGFHPNATQSIALRKRKPQTTQAFDWLLRWLAVSIDHSYWLALACVTFEWKPVLRNVFCLRILLRLLRFLRTFLTQSIALRAFGWKPGFTCCFLLVILVR